jgi:integrase
MGRANSAPGRRVKLPEHVKAYTVNGKAYFYFRDAKPPVQLPGLPWSPEFMAVHARAMAARRTPGPVAIGAGGTVRGSVNAAIVAYYQSGGFLKGLAQGSQGMTRALLERFRKDFGDLPMRAMQAKHVQDYLAKLKTPAAQLNMLKALKRLCLFTAGNGLSNGNPTVGVARARVVSTGGHYAWTEDDVAKFQATHPVGSQARLALALYLNLGVRKSDVIRIGPRHIRDGELADFQPKKTERTGGKLINIPLLRDTKAIIAATPVTGTETYLVTAFGKPYSANGFGNRMRKWCDEAGLPDCTSHGLRKLCAIRLAELELSAPQIAAVLGHKNLSEVQTYVDAADRKRMARQAMGAVEKSRKGKR